MKFDGYTRISWRTAKALNIKGNDLLIYCLIESLSRSKGGWMQFDYKRMAEIYNITERCAINSVQHLLNKNLIEKRIGRGVNANQYRPTVCGEKSSPQSEDGVGKKFSSSGEENSERSRKKFTNSTEESSPKNKVTEFKSNNNINKNGFYRL